MISLNTFFVFLFEGEQISLKDKKDKTKWDLVLKVSLWKSEYISNDFKGNLSATCGQISEFFYNSFWVFFPGFSVTWQHWRKY